MEITRTNQKTLLSNNEFEGLCVIKNFPDIHHADGDDYEESPKFFTGRNDEYEWKLDIFKAGYQIEYSEYVSIRFFLLNDEDVDLKELASLQVIAAILDGDGGIYLKKSAIIDFGLPNTWIFKDFILRKELEDNPKLLPNGELKIIFKIFFHEKIKPSQISQLKILGEVLDAGNYTDFKLIVRGKEFNVHRAILAARSPVFQTMFTSNTRESSEGKVEIDDVEPAVMEELLRFVYVGDVEDLVNFGDILVKKVLEAANKYQIDELKQMCEDVLVERLSLGNIYETLRLADETNAENLKEKAIAFFHRNAQKLYSDSDFKAHLNSLSGHLKTDIIRIFIMDKQ